MIESLTAQLPASHPVVPQPLDSEAVVYRPPSSWPTDNRTRKFTPLSERSHSLETDSAILRRSVDLLLKRQDARGSFYTDEDYRSGDKVDDQLAGASLLALFLEKTGTDPALTAALERAVRFHLDHLVSTSPSQPYRYSRYFIDRDTGEWCNTLWCLWGAALVLRHGESFLSRPTATELRGLMDDYWSFVSTYPARDENPCHNQLIAYCHIGHLYAQTVGNQVVAAEISAYYHQRLRRLRLKDRGHWIYTEFNQWDPHYGLVSWMALEALALETGDPAYHEDADAMALYFNERVSAGGYVWGGSRHNEGGLDEFVHLPASRATELGLDRLLLPEPSHLWQSLAMPPHEGRTLVTRMEAIPPARPTKRPLTPTSWHFMRGTASACLREDFKLLHLSADGLEIIPEANALGVGSGLVWLKGSAWKKDFLQSNPPAPSAGHRYHHGIPIHLREATGLTTTQRGYIWETRQWWIKADGNLLWIVQLVTHAAPACDKLKFILGTPVVTRLGSRAVPVTDVETAEGLHADTQGEAIIVSSGKFLKFGDIHVGATEPLEFNRPSRDAFHTFPMREGLPRDCESSNVLRVKLAEKATTYDCRESLFFAIEIGRDKPSLAASRTPSTWRLEAPSGIFEARQSNGIWDYSFATAAGREPLPQIGFGFQDRDDSPAAKNGLPQPTPLSPSH